MLFTVNFGAAQTGVGYRFFNGSGFVGARLDAGVTQIGTAGNYLIDVTPPATALGVYWDCDNPYMNGQEVFEDKIGIEGYTVKQALTLILAAIAAQSTGFGTNTVVFRNIANDKARITATVDAEGNRTAITLDPD